MMLNFAVSLLSVIVPLALCELYYIKSSHDQICPTEPCLMLNDFINQTRENYSQDAISISLLPGNHSMDTDMHIASMATFVIISSTEDRSYNVIVSCKNYERFSFFNVSRIEMSNIQISGCFIFSNKSNLTMENCNFRASSQISDYVQIYVIITTLRIKHCSFVGIRNGTILYGEHSNVTISHSIFKNNTGRILKLISGFVQLNRCEFERNECLFEELIIDENDNETSSFIITMLLYVSHDKCSSCVCQNSTLYMVQ